MQRKMLAALIALGFAAGAHAQSQPTGAISDNVVKIGLLLDMSSLYADITGTGSVAAAQMAIADFGGKVLGKPVELVYADHQNKADIAASKAREWFDRDRVDAILDVAASGPALAVAPIAKEKNRIAVFSGPGSARLTGDACTPVTVHYAYDTYALANATARAVVKNGGDSWFFLTADYTFGTTLEKDASDVIRANGGKVLGSVRHPLNASDFSSFLVQAQGSGAKVIGLANAGGDTINAIKAAREFGLTTSGKQSLAGLLVYINDVHTLGLNTAQGMLLTTGFYWDHDDESRKWSRRFFEKTKKMPNMSQAGLYSSVMHYLNAVQAAGTDETGAVMQKMRELPVNDMFAKNGRIREDGRMVHDMYLYQVKKPAESKSPWDYYKLVSTIPGEQAFQPLSASSCPLVKK
ncbi:ABC transporter substrate-binding protein [Noviherbaspirillum pedocola]|uniref:ABC transporter substrate-binding protein n=1 Tax=Noviherbaspirillum pedocola TaxID=2801341 RepID=A0A934W8W1_9BURK|nr:ABC transporter substrate-binding protein [Noviherbaspirillum pedocola]MBK4738055.1 ABC transporter substrate-binding protein [Noviherbaspirillum pedocola]